LPAIQRGGDRFKNPRQIAQHVVVPEAEDAISLIAKPFVSWGIPRIGRVLTAVDFDHQAVFATDEIRDVWSDRLLPHKLEAVQTAIADGAPKARLGKRQFPAQHTGAANPSGIRSTHQTPLTRRASAPTSPRKRGEVNIALKT
jgi:hypothetical protein